MKACIYSEDRICIEIVARCLRDLGFSYPEISPDAVDALPSEIIFIDLDLDIADVIYDKLTEMTEERLPVIFFGSNPETSPKTSIDVILRKPFEQDKIKNAISRKLLGLIKIQKTPLLNLSPEQEIGKDILIKAWQHLVDTITDSAVQLEQLLNATPQQLRKALTSKTNFSDEDNPQIPTDELPLKSVLIIESDMTFAKGVMKYLSRKCVLQTEVAADTKEAWDRLKTNSFDLVVMNWDLKNMESLAFYNRLRRIPQFESLPITVMSSVVKSHEFRLLDDDFCVAMIEKPFQERTFSEVLSKLAMSTVLTRKFLPQVVNIVRSSIEQNALEVFSDSLIESDPVILNALKLAGDVFLKEKNYQLAETAYTWGWKLGDKRLSLLTNLAKVYYLTSRPKQARQLLSTSEVIAPGSVERLCLIGEIDLSELNPKQARGYFTKALEIDKFSKKAQAGINLSNNLEKYSVDNGGFPAGANFASYLNIIGIGLAQTGNSQAALQYYRSAMAFVYNSDSLAKLWFNTAISFLRGGNKEKAEKAFHKAYEVSGKTFEKAAKYLEEPSSGFDILFEKI